MINFIPVTGFFAGNIAAGAGLVVQVTYTVPANKRAILYHTYVQANANAGAVGVVAEIVVDVVPINNVSSNRINTQAASGLAVRTSNGYMPHFDLIPGDLVRIFTVNASAVIIGMQAGFVVREYQQ